MMLGQPLYMTLQHHSVLQHDVLCAHHFAGLVVATPLAFPSYTPAPKPPCQKHLLHRVAYEM
jgi:hypothetical protein